MKRLFRLARRMSCLTALVLAAALAAGTPLWADQSPCPSAPFPKGAWAQQGGTAQFLFEPERVVFRQDGKFRAATILSRGPCKLIVRVLGIRATWALTGDEHGLQLDEGKGPLVLAPLPELPPSLDINPPVLPPLRPVPVEKMKEISKELTLREQRDQDALRKPEAEAKDLQLVIQSENARYLREVASRYGWIDIPRFGKPAAAAAILIVKHSQDVPLMQAALPIVERDAIENGGGKELVSILVDAVLIMTGHKQKYGTQINEDAGGKPYIIPVEDPAKVDEYRKTLGIPPWSDYLNLASKALYDGAPIRLPGADE